MTIRSLPNQKQTLGVWWVSESGRDETNHDEQRESKN
jgi:hypothetical protein